MPTLHGVGNHDYTLAMTFAFDAQRLSSAAFEATTVFAAAKMGGGSNVRCSDLLDAIWHQVFDCIAFPGITEARIFAHIGLELLNAISTGVCTQPRR